MICKNSVRWFGRSNSIAMLAIAIGVSLFNFTSLKAIAKDTSFQTPSGNIHCDSDVGNLRCDMETNKTKLPPKPKNCNLEWGNRLVMSAKGLAERACHIDTISDPKHPILGYGKTWRSKGFTCVSKATGLTCTNKDGRGWTLSKNKQQLF